MAAHQPDGVAGELREPPSRACMLLDVRVREVSEDRAEVELVGGEQDPVALVEQ